MKFVDRREEWARLDGLGAPGLAVMALTLILVILLARRLRTAPAK